MVNMAVAGRWVATPAMVSLLISFWALGWANTSCILRMAPAGTWASSNAAKARLVAKRRLPTVAGSINFRGWLPVCCWYYTFHR